jgi:hypothetical protein
MRREAQASVKAEARIGRRKWLRTAGGKSLDRMLLAAFKLALLGRAMLREIFDESAYERFLARNSMPSSSQAYLLFLQESGQIKSRRPRCC